MSVEQILQTNYKQKSSILTNLPPDTALTAVLQVQLVQKCVYLKKLNKSLEQPYGTLPLSVTKI